jgi:hypothetical protein
MNFPNDDIDFHRHMSCSFMFNELRGNVIGCFDDAGGIFYQLCFNCLLGIAYHYILLHRTRHVTMKINVIIWEIHNTSIKLQ